MSNAHLEKALSIFGSQERLALACGVSQVAISKLLRAKRVSAEMAVKIETATEGKIPRWRLRPDLWSPRADEAAMRTPIRDASPP